MIRFHCSSSCIQNLMIDMVNPARSITLRLILQTSPNLSTQHFPVAVPVLDSTPTLLQGVTCQYCFSLFSAGSQFKSPDPQPTSCKRISGSAAQPFLPPGLTKMMWLANCPSGLTLKACCLAGPCWPAASCTEVNTIRWSHLSP